MYLKNSRDCKKYISPSRRVQFALLLSRCLSFSHQTSTFSRDKLPSEEFPDKRYTLRRITRFMTFFDVFAAPVCSSSASVILVVPFVIVLWPRRRRRFTIMPSRAFPFILHFRLNSDQPFLPGYLLFFLQSLRVRLHRWLRMARTTPAMRSAKSLKWVKNTSNVLHVSDLFANLFVVWTSALGVTCRYHASCISSCVLKARYDNFFTIFYWEKIRII